MIIAVVSLKGGVAKTTTAVLLSMCAAEAGQQVVLLDGDPEQSAVAWAIVAKTMPFRVIRADADGLTRQAKDLAEAGQTVIIDTPPNAKDVLMSAALAADVAVVPVSPTAIDVTRLSRTLKVLLDVGSVRPDLDVQILVTRFTSGTRLARATAELLKDYPVLPTLVRDLERYKAMGGTVPVYLDEYREVWKALRRPVPA
jgi:chromosome partitioning protein